MMRIISRLWDKLHPEPKADTGPVTTVESLLEAKTALESAKESLDIAVGNKERVAFKTDALRYQAGRNHFAELIESAMRGAG